MIRLLLVRHGESTWNAQSRWQGQADPPLSPFGERQAEDVVVVTHGGVIRTIERSLGATPERLPNLGGRWILADSPTDLALGDRVVLLEPEEVTVPRGPSEQDPVRTEDDAQ